MAGLGISLKVGVEGSVLVEGQREQVVEHDMDCSDVPCSGFLK